MPIGPKITGINGAAQGALDRFLEDTKKPVSQRGLGQRLIAATLAGFDESGDIANSIRSREAESREEERRNREKEEDREFRRNENEKNRDFQKEQSDADREYRERQAELKRSLKLQDEEQERAFDVISDALKDMPDNDPRRQKIIQEFGAKYGAENAAILNNISLSDIEQQKANTEQRRVDNSSKQLELTEQRLNEVDILNAQTAAKNAETAALNSRVPAKVSANDVKNAETFLSSDVDYKKISKDTDKRGFAQATSELSRIIQKATPGLSSNEALLRASTALKGAVITTGADNFVPFDEKTSFDPQEAAKIIGKMRPPVVGEIRVLSSGKQARYLGNNQWAPVQ